MRLRYGNRCEILVAPGFETLLGYLHTSIYKMVTGRAGTSFAICDGRLTNRGDGRVKNRNDGRARGPNRDDDPARYVACDRNHVLGRDRHALELYCHSLPWSAS